MKWGFRRGLQIHRSVITRSMPAPRQSPKNRAIPGFLRAGVVLFQLTYTWLSQARGHEVTFNAGYLLNTRNTASDYCSGNEFHVDFLLAQHFTSQFAVGVPGYWYKQVTGNDADMLDQLNLGSFRGEAAGLGRALIFKPAVAGKDVNVVLKWVHDIRARQRFEGSEIMLSVAFKLSR